MPTGVYVRTKECKKHLSEAKRGKPSNMKDKHHTEESKQKMSDSQKKRYETEEVWNKGKKGIHLSPKSEFKKGRKSEYKGKHVQTNTDRTHFKKGHLPWSTGLEGRFPEETKKKMSDSASKRKASEETKKKMSDMKKGKIPSPKSGHGKIFKYNSPFQKEVKLRSSYELAYAKYLDSNNIKWYYEWFTFDLGNTTYTPDFFLPETNDFVEIKGYMHPIQGEKIKKFGEFYPNKKLKIVFKEDLKELGIGI